MPAPIIESPRTLSAKTRAPFGKPQRLHIHRDAAIRLLPFIVGQAGRDGAVDRNLDHRTVAVAVREHETARGVSRSAVQRAFSFQRFQMLGHRVRAGEAEVLLNLRTSMASRPARTAARG